MTYCNLKTQTEEALPRKLAEGVFVDDNKLTTEHKNYGYRQILTTDDPAPGYRVTQWGYADIDGTNARKIILLSVNIADEEASQTAIEAAEKEQRVKDYLLSPQELVQVVIAVKNFAKPTILKEELDIIVREIVIGK